MKLKPRSLALCSLLSLGLCHAQTVTPSPSAAGYPAAEAAYQAGGRGDHAAALQSAREAVRLSPEHGPYRLLLVNLLLQTGDAAQAEREATQWLALHEKDAQMLAARSRVRAKLGQSEAADEDARAALAGGPLSAASEIELLLMLGQNYEARQRLARATAAGELADMRPIDRAYLALRVGDDEAALAAFQQAESAGALPDRARLDAAYAASRAAQADVAVRYFRQALAASAAGRLALTPQQRFDIRRAIADRTRHFGSYVSLSYRGMVPGRQLAPVPGTREDSLQGSIEGFWRPWGYRDGSFVELFGGVLETLYSKNKDAPTGASTARGALGLRVKPFSSVNLVLALERHLAIGDQARTDWLGRIGFSHSVGTDLRVDVSSWTMAQVYAEAGRYADQHLTYGTMEAQLGRSFRLGGFDGRTVLTPHVVFGADYNSRVADGQQVGASGAGLGVNLRHWFNAQQDAAPRSYADLSLQYRTHVGGDTRAKGVFVRALVAF